MAEQSRRRNRKKEEVDSAEEVAQEPDKDTKGETPAEEEAEEPDPLVLARNEAEDYKDRWIRLAAEFDNYKKRTAREFQAVVRSASERVIRDLLPVLDAFDRAINLDDEARGNPDSYQEVGGRTEGAWLVLFDELRV